MIRLALRFVIALLVLALVTFPASGRANQALVVAPDASQLTAATVARVVDGDTVHVTLDGQDATLRLIGVDTPETVDPRGPVGCFGREASTFTKHLLSVGTQVWLERDVSETDRYGRLLRYVWIAFDATDPRFADLVGLDGVEDGQLVLVNQLLVGQGYAASSAYPPDVAYQTTFVDDQRAARDAGRGLWGACSAFGVPAASQQGQPTARPTPPAPRPPTAAAGQTTAGDATGDVSAGGTSCDPSYPGVCIPPISVAGDLDCGDVPYRRFQVLPPDPHGFDANGDGEGCEG